jgi:hypothetical protein
MTLANLGGIAFARRDLAATRLDECCGLLRGAGRAGPRIPSQPCLLGVLRTPLEALKARNVPSFREWLKASENCPDQALDEYGMREERRRLIKLSRRVGPRVLYNGVTRYLDWEVFAYWARTAIEAGRPLPVSVDREVNRRCPGFLEADAAAHSAKPEEESHFRFYRLLDWIGEHDFGQVQKQGWYEVLLYQVELHARHTVRSSPPPASSTTGTIGSQVGRRSARTATRR